MSAAIRVWPEAHLISCGSEGSQPEHVSKNLEQENGKSKKPELKVEEVGRSNSIVDSAQEVI